MNKQKITYLVSLFLFATILLAGNFSSDDRVVEKPVQPASDYTSEQNFDKVMQVLTHKRCLNCHPSNNIPKQGEDSHPHYFGIQRGLANHGFEATNCNTCHQQENNLFSGVPGAPQWGLAPASMSWEGLSRTEIAEVLLDPKRNGGRSAEELIQHLTSDALVLWAWDPGIDSEGTPREKPPVPKAEFIAAVKDWFAAGAVIPAK